MRLFSKNSWQNGIILVFAVIAVMSTLHLADVFSGLELKSYDMRFRFRGSIPTDESNIVLVTIDDQSFISLKHKWPFPRTYFARAINNLADAGAALIILDVEFLEPSTFHPNDDKILAKVIQKYPRIIFAGKLVTEYGAYSTVNQYPIKPLPELLAAGAHWAYANVYLDEDGFIRRYNLYQNIFGKTYYPLVIEALRYLQKITSEPNATEFEGDYFAVGNFKIPKYDTNSMLINYSGSIGNFPTYSFANILDDQNYDLPDEMEDTDIFDIYKDSGIFKDKIVFIGASAEELQDNKLTPYFNFNGEKRKMPGVEMHANALNAIMNEQYIHPVNQWKVILIIVLLSGLALLISMKLKPINGLIIIILIGILYTTSAFWLFSHSQIWIPLIFPLTCLSSSYFVNIINKILIEQREKGRYRKTFQQYIARSVVDTMLNSGELPKFGGERKNLTVLFSDIRSFTTYSEKHPPEVVVKRLTEYLSSMVDVIFNHGGTLDKFVGDEIMAIFGAPYYFENHAERACLTALEMVSRLRKIQKSWSEREMEYFQIGIGINTGKVIVGNLGSIQLFDYTVIGDEVNLGARLEGANKHYSTTVIISESTYKEVGDRAIVRELDNVRVKGKKRPVKIYELRGMYSLPNIEKDLIIDVYTYGLNLFKQQKWNQALKEFRRVLRYFPSDGPSRVYTLRCLEYIEKPPPENWDGVFEFAVK